MKRAVNTHTDTHVHAHTAVNAVRGLESSGGEVSRALDHLLEGLIGNGGPTPPHTHICLGPGHTLCLFLAVQ